MDNLDVKIKTLPAMLVASFYAYGTEPEIEGLGKLITWAKAHDCWKPAPATRIFGFDHPAPAPGSPNRGYEFWLTVSPEIQQDQDIKIMDFSGGKYATLLCEVKANPYDIIPQAWQKLVKWQESSHYKLGSHQYLEEHLSRGKAGDPDFVLDLYLPVVE